MNSYIVYPSHDNLINNNKVISTQAYLSNYVRECICLCMTVGGEEGERKVSSHTIF